MPLRHQTLVAWQRADDLFIAIHTLDLQIRQTIAALNGYIRSVRDGVNESRRNG